ncbi:hypothetical protein DI005_05850 [Prauserella sp. PE36]|nr:hypothetical protein BAY59_13405 [Prauserella coralliicola]RBM22661.1 hypothetical protein DI005_05850 [Prauserella sp. PE36]
MTAFAAAGLTGLAGCADRPNDLDTYYDEPETTTESATVTASPPPPSAPPPEPGADPVVLAAAVDGAVLPDQDVAAEGVRPVAALTVAEGCLAEIPLGLVGTERRDARWEYPTGSTIDQLVTAYAERPAAEILTSRVRCPGDELEVPLEPAVDAHAAWCAEGTCTVLLASGNVLSGVQVTAADRARAAAAVQRLAPVAAAKLAQP